MPYNSLFKSQIQEMFHRFSRDCRYHMSEESLEGKLQDVWSNTEIFIFNSKTKFTQHSCDP